MPTPREIKSRIQSIANTQKITRTMELVATAKAKKAVDRVQSAQPYAKKIFSLVQDLMVDDAENLSPLLRKPEKIRRAAILVITANRGLCGGFNANVLRLALSYLAELQEKGIKTEVHLLGKKALSYFTYRQLPFASKETGMDDKPTFALACRYADSFMKQFSQEEVDEVSIVYTQYLNASQQKPVVKQVLPLVDKAKEAQTKRVMIYEEDPNKILQELLPKALRVTFFQAMLESVAGEQIARRIAMKNATDAAQDMIRTMTLEYNRARQAKITQEIAEIVGGAAAISD